MNSQDFLTLNLVGAGAFLFWYLVSRGGPQKPTQLNLKAKDNAPPPLLDPVAETGIEPLRRPAQGTPASVHMLHPDLARAARTATAAKSLNVMFNYNGHSWDAYEVLGVPAGASLMTVTEAYNNALRRCDKESVEFLETAYRTIMNK